MQCQRLRQRTKLSDRWHRLWCSECRTQGEVDSLFTRGIRQMQAKPPPPEGLEQTLGRLGLHPPEGSQRSTALHRRFGPLSVPRVVVTGALILLGVWAVGSVFWTGLSSYHQPPGKGAPEDGFWGQGPFLRLSLLDRAEAEPAKQALEAVKGAGTIHFVNRSC